MSARSRVAILAGGLLGLAGLGFWVLTRQRHPTTSPVTSPGRPSIEDPFRGLPHPPQAELAPPTASGAPSTAAELPAPPESPRAFWKELETLEITDKEQALEYALLGERWYEDTGKPAEARRAKIVTLLVDLGRMAEARARTRAFLQQYPTSPYRPLVQGVTGIYPRPGRPGLR